MHFILENFGTGSKFQIEQFEIPLGMEPDDLVAIGRISFYPHWVIRRGHLNAVSPYELEVAILDERGSDQGETSGQNLKG